VPESYLAGDGFEWHSDPPSNRVRTARENILTGIMGVKGPAARSLGNKPTPKQLWDLLVDDVIINEIVKWTNMKLTAAHQKISDKSVTNTTEKMNQKNLLGKYRQTNNDEINAYIAVLLLASIYKSS